MRIRRIVKIAAIVIGIFLLIGLGQCIYKQWPRTIPTDPDDLRKAGLSILQDKCIACHSTAEGLPFYASIPVGGSLVKEDFILGQKNWDLADVGRLGPDAKFNADNPHLPITTFNKFEKVIREDSMPPLQYLSIHWGTNLSSSEKEILTQWIKLERAKWLSQWGLEQYADSLVQPIPDSIPYDKAKARLGEELYNDVRLSKDNSISCASCHALDKGGTDQLVKSPGVGGQLGGVNAPTTFNAVFHINQFWDGRASTLAEQAGGPPLNPVEMASENWEEVIVKLKEDDVFTPKFIAVYPEGYSGDTICDAIAEYEKSLITPNSRFDQFLKGDKGALTENERKGYQLFLDNNCANCHAGPALGGQSFEYMGLKGNYFHARELTPEDRGLEAFSRNPKDNARFKVPTLRNVEITYPYYHDGSIPDLEGAVKSMLTYQVGVKATDQEIRLITDYLKTLTGELFGKPLKPEPAAN